MNREPETPDWREVPCGRAGFSARTQHCLENEGMATLGSVASMPSHLLLRIPNLGRKSLDEIDAVFEEYGVVGPGKLNQVRFQRERCAARLRELERAVDYARADLARIDAQLANRP